jgi:predicted HTH domain antitoxin
VKWSLAARPEEKKMSNALNTIDIPYGNDILASAGMSRSELAEAAKIAIAAKLFQDGKISMGQAAKMCGRGKVYFMEELIKRGYSCVNLTADDAEDELRFINGE